MKKAGLIAMEMWYDLIGQYGYVAIYLLLTLGIVGLPVPDEVLMAYLGYVTSIGKLSYTLTVFSGIAGSVTGITISYILGVKLGEPFIRKYGSKLFIKEKAIARTNRLFHKYGALMLFICYFIPGVRHVAAYLAGITGYSYRKFSLYAYTGAVFWVLIFVTIGNHLGSHWGIIFGFTQNYMHSMLVLLVIVVAVSTIWYFFRKKKKRDV